MDNDENINLQVTKTELITLNNALNEILSGPDAIDDNEFQTRVGVTKEDAQMLLKKISQLLDE